MTPTYSVQQFVLEFGVEMALNTPINVLSSWDRQPLLEIPARNVSKSAKKPRSESVIFNGSTGVIDHDVSAWLCPKSVASSRGLS